MLSGVDTDALPMIRHSQQGVNYHDLMIRDLFTKLREEGTEDVPMFGGAWYCGILADGIVLVNMTRHFADMTDNRVAGEMECLLRENAHRYGTAAEIYTCFQERGTHSHGSDDRHSRDTTYSRCPHPYR